MHLVAQILIGLVALLHLYFLALEMFFWDKPLGRKVFNLKPDFATQSKALAANQGLYNGFLAAGGCDGADPAHAVNPRASAKRVRSAPISASTRALTSFPRAGNR